MARLSYLRIPTLLFLVPLVSGCWFVYIPGTVVQSVSDGITGSFGNACVSPSAKMGEKVRTPTGGTATITAISGPSSRCQNAATPIRAEVTYDYQGL